MAAAAVRCIRLGITNCHLKGGLHRWILVEHELDLSSFGAEARVLHTPGHTAGSLTVRTASGHAATADAGGASGDEGAGKPRVHGIENRVFPIDIRR
ncbi:MAG: hypothetical protein V2L15_01535 [Desulfobacteraceae bacterium]|jgi:glyoxylase-like metal-dependent hydrolase (beta-lactamase superfamily II)|nr:hypothetical protein [Desulfobacteraceae bacterium]